MTVLSSRQTEVRDRDKRILNAGRAILLERGYYGLTMERIAKACDCPKGTMYQHFACKEDIVLALARHCVENRSDMMRRAAGFPGQTRERVLAVGEAVVLYTRLNPDDSRILHSATGPIREKASFDRVAALVRIECESIGILRQLLLEAVNLRELALPAGSTVDEMVFAVWSLVDGAFGFIESGAHESVLHLKQPFTNVFRAFHILADGYGWRPLFAELDSEETLASIRKTIFPEEAQKLYGEGMWYGDQG